MSGSQGRDETPLDYPTAKFPSPTRRMCQYQEPTPLLSSESRPFELSTLLHEIADKWHKFS